MAAFFHFWTVRAEVLPTAIPTAIAIYRCRAFSFALPLVNPFPFALDLALSFTLLFLQWALGGVVSLLIAEETLHVR